MEKIYDSIVELATNEIEKKTWGVTEQFLSIHELIYDDNKLKIAHIDQDDPAGTGTVYFPVKNEKFYFVIYFETTPGIKITGVGTEADHRIYFKATSGNLNFDQLSSLTILKPTSGWNKGDSKRYGKSIHSFSYIEFMPNPEAGDFADKLSKLLDFLEGDKDGVRKLANIAHAQIQVATIFHNGNTMLGGFHLDKTLLRRLKELEVDIDFDLYAEGHFFK